jgi:hypothetical protein
MPAGAAGEGNDQNAYQGRCGYHDQAEANTSVDLNG